MRVTNYKESMEKVGNNPRYPLDFPLKSIELEFKKGLEGGSMDTNYIKGKIKVLSSWVEEAEKIQKGVIK